MIKQLCPAFLFITFIFSVSAQSHSNQVHKTVNVFSHDMVVLNLIENSNKITACYSEVFSYSFINNYNTPNHHGDSEFHSIDSHDISLIDIISSDEGADFNCSGGFCMDRSHFHKKGLTLKKQLFYYFMKISC